LTHDGQPKFGRKNKKDVLSQSFRIKKIKFLNDAYKIYI